MYSIFFNDMKYFSVIMVVMVNGFFVYDFIYYFNGVIIFLYKFVILRLIFLEYMFIDRKIVF